MQSRAVFLINIEDAEDKIIVILIKATDQPEGVPCGDSVYQQAVFNVLHASLFHVSKQFFLLDVFYEYMLVFFDYDFPAVTDNVLKKVVSALLEVQRMKFMVNGIPKVFVCLRINIINTGVVTKQRLRYFLEDIVLFRHKSLRIKESDLSGNEKQTRRNGL